MGLLHGSGTLPRDRGRNESNTHRLNPETQAMKMLNTLTSNAYHDLIDYNVVDQGGDHVGTLHSLWSDQNTGALEFLGVKTGWLFGKNHVVPASSAQIDEDNRFVQIPFAADFIKEAPSIAADAEITEEQEAEIYRYYGLSGAQAATGVSSASATTEHSATRTATGTEATTISDLGRGAATAAGAGTAGYAATTGATTTREARTGETIEVPVSEEQLHVGKRTVDAGSVRLRKVIRTETVNTPIELRREDVTIERVPAGEVRATAGATAFEGEEIVVPVSHEEAVIAKETVVTGAVRMHKTAETETQNVSDTVRKEDVQVDRGSVGVTHGTATGTATGMTGSTGAVSTGYTATGGSTHTTGASGDANPDALTGEPGSHPVGTAIGGVSGALTGAAVGGAGAMATGAAFGTAAGPVGAVIGGIAGAVVGGMVGKGVEEYFDPTEEAAYWKENYRSSSSYDPSMSYEEYEPAYRSGYTGFGKYYGTGKRFEDVEGDIRRDYEGSGSRLAYDKARSHIKEAYDRVFQRASSGQRRSS